MGKAPKLELITLGGLRILLDGEPIQGLASRKAEALLVYLAVTSRPHAREHLATMLWDDRPLGRSLANLSVLLNSLKKQLEPFLQIERQSIALNPAGNIQLDLHALQQAVKAWDPGSEVGSSVRQEAMGRLDAALSGYEGDFLQGFYLREARGFDEWASLERERTQRLVQINLHHLVDAYLREGDQDSGIRILHKGLALDPLDEDLQRKLMRSLALAGQMTAAIAQYQDCAALLKGELQVEPSLATRRLYDRILARRERPHDNLPALTSSTIGREAEIAEIQHKLLDPRTRLLTLVGAGGIGKTRLALEASKTLKGAFLEGLWFVDLAPLEDPALVAQSIGRVLAMPDGPARESGGNPSEAILARMIEFLEDKELLLILDNCEHILDECVQISEKLLLRCPELKILVTSRERLDLAAEQIFLVEPLDVPTFPPADFVKVDELRLNGSIRLFEERARAIRAQFTLDERNAETLVRICRVLDGIPLAIELAASRLHTISLAQMAANLEESLQGLARDHTILDPRHQTLEAAIDWSYHLLTVEDQQQFRLATVFRGGFTQNAFIDVSQALGFKPQAAEASLAHLVEKSLVLLRADEHPPSRYILLEPVRQFGTKRFETDPYFETVQDAHASYYLQMSEAVTPDLHGPKRKDKVALLEIDADNLRAALRYSLTAEDRAACLRFAQALWEGFWLNQGYFSEGRDWIDRIMAVCGESRESGYGVLILARGAFAWTLGDLDTAMSCFLQAQSIAEEQDDKHLIQWTMYWQAFVLSDRSQFLMAGACLDRGLRLAVEVGAKRGEGWQIYCQAHIARVTGKNQEAVQLFRQALEILTEEDVFGSGWCYIYLGYLAMEEQNLDQARQYLRESHRIYEELNNPRGIGGAERGLGILDLETGNFELAEEHLRRSRQLFEQLGWVKMASSSEIYLGYLATMEGRPEEAEELLLDSLEYQRRESDMASIAHLLFILGLLAKRKNEDLQAMELIAAADVLGQELDVAFPLHLVSAVEETQRDLKKRGVKLAEPARSANELVDFILLNQDSWLELLQSPSKPIS